MNLKEDEYWLIQTGLRYGPVTSSDVDMWQNQIQTSGRNKNSLFSEYTLNNLLIPRFLATWTEINSGGHVFSKYVLCNLTHAIGLHIYLLQLQIQSYKADHVKCNIAHSQMVFPCLLNIHTPPHPKFEIKVMEAHISLCIVYQCFIWWAVFCKRPQVKSSVWAPHKYGLYWADKR